MIYRSCTGCIHSGIKCAARDAVRSVLKGLGATSIKWKCKDRVAKIHVGDAVWAETVDCFGKPDEGVEPCRGEFPAIAIRDLGSRFLVLIEDGVSDRNGELTFEASANGFCKIPIARISQRDGAKETICQSCDWPSSRGHQPGYLCDTEARRAAGVSL